MRHKNPIQGLAILALGAPLLALAVPTVQGTQAFTDHVGLNPVVPSGWRLVVGASSVLPSGTGTTVQAVHQGGQIPWNYAVPATPYPVFPDGYFVSVPYTDQVGRWQLQATDGSGTGVATTHLLSDVRQLPLLQGLTASGPLLTPTVGWDRVDPLLYPSLCQPPCAVGFDFFNYGVLVRDMAGSVLYQSAAIPNLPSTPTRWTLPAGVLQADRDYLIGFRLTMNELEAINPNGSFVSPLENRSSAYLPYTTAVPEPGSWALWLAGLLGLPVLAARRARRPDCAARSA